MKGFKQRKYYNLAFIAGNTCHHNGIGIKSPAHFDIAIVTKFKDLILNCHSLFQRIGYHIFYANQVIDDHDHIVKFYFPQANYSYLAR